MPAPDLGQACWFFGAVAAGFLALLGVMLLVLRRRAEPAFQPVRELACGAAVLGLALTVMNPLLRTTATGAGDSYHYALQAADFVTQLRAGVFPVLVGQSVYGFNGNIHTLRTAPYYVHLCGAVDFLMWHRLTAFALENLVVVLSALAAAAAAYLVIRALAPASRVGAALLAMLYITAPGVTGPILGRDMYATFMIMPWLPLVVLGLVNSFRPGAALGALALATGAFALVWYAHPPSGILLTPLVTGAGLWRLIRGPERGVFLVGAIAATAAFFVLTGYLFYSVGSMELGYVAKALSNSTQPFGQEFVQLWPGILAPITADGRASTDLQPGYAVLALAGLTWALLRRNRPAAWVLAVAFVGYLAACLPWDPVTFVWARLPERFIPVLQPWPHQRIMPILTVIAIMGGALSLAVLRERGPAWQRASLVLLAVAVAWNLHELGKFTALAPPQARLAPAMERPLPADNVVLTRSSYLLFGFYPGYYSHGYMDPASETRLLDPERQQPVLANDAYLLAHTAPEGSWRDLAQPARFPLRPGAGCVLEFTFSRPDAVGEIIVASGLMHRVYALPRAGEPLAFGSLPESRHTLLVTPGSHDGKLLDVHTSVPGVAVRLHFYDETMLPLRVKSLVPFDVETRTDAPGLVETPRVFIPGYRATVNGRETPVSRSPEGLVMVPVPAGASEVRVDYPGPRGLQAAFFVSLLGLVAWPAATWFCFRRCRWQSLPGPAWRWTALLVGAGLAAGVGGFLLLPARTGATVQLTVDLPHEPTNPSEPLLVFGQPGAADVIYLHYDDAHHFRVGYDHWGSGGPLSEPVAFTPGQRVVIEATLGGLAAKRDGGGSTAPVRIAIGGHEVLAGNLPWHPASRETMSAGVNAIGASSCAARFSGRIVMVVRSK